MVKKGRRHHVDARNILLVELLDQFRRFLKQRVGGEDPAKMIAHVQDSSAACFKGGDDIGVSDGGKIFRDIIARGAVAAQRAGDDHQIADLDVFLQRAAAADANQRLRAGAAKNFRGDGRVRRVATAVADA